jgi:hypothetical protein
LSSTKLNVSIPLSADEATRHEQREDGMSMMQRRWRAAGILILAAGLAAASVGAEQSPVRFVSPAGGTVVRPGQTVTIEVAADSSVEKLALIGQHPLPVSQVVAPGLGVAQPFEFQVRIPTDISPGPYRVRAVGVLAGGEPLAESLVLNVEKAEEPTRIWAKPQTILFSGAGERIPLRVLGAFADGSQETLTKSSKTIYTSGDPDVATVSADGLVTAVGPGKTSIQVRTMTRECSIPVTVADGSNNADE